MNFELNDKEFLIIKDLTEKLIGIKLNDSKRALVVARLSARLRSLNISSFSEYLNFLGSMSNPQEEITHFVNKITTNETYFFREPKHFQLLSSKILPTLMAKKLKEGNLSIRIWSSACSTGEEPYSIAMTLLDFFRLHPGFDIKILASDINSEVLEKAEHGEYHISDITQNIPPDVLRRYFYKTSKTTYKINDDVKKHVLFKNINLLDDQYPIKKPLDIIFCRNVMIYFEEHTRNLILTKFNHYLNKNGYLFIGHSENLFNNQQHFSFLESTIYMKDSNGV